VSSTPHRTIILLVVIAVGVLLSGLALGASVLWRAYTRAPSPPPAPIDSYSAQPRPLTEKQRSQSLVEDRLSEISGPDPQDCGCLAPDATESEMQEALACALSAALADRAFVSIKSDYGVDSWIPNGLIKGRVGPIVWFAYDSFSTRPLETERCTSSPVLTSQNVLRPVGLRGFDAIGVSPVRRSRHASEGQIGGRHRCRGEADGLASETHGRSGRTRPIGQFKSTTTTGSVTKSKRVTCESGRRSQEPSPPRVQLMPDWC